MAIGVGISGPRSSGGGGATGGYVRTEWLAMPTLSNGDDKIVLLVAVWENASNFITLKCNTFGNIYYCLG